MRRPAARLSAIGLITASLFAVVPAHAGSGYNFTNRTTAGLRCRLATEASNTAMTITLESMESFSVAGPYKDIRCEEPVIRKRFALTEGGRYIFHRNKDGSTISMRSE